MISLFQRKDWIMHSGGKASYKIECDALTSEDWDTLAYIIASKGPIKEVYGVPSGGIPLANALEKYVTPDRGIRLIVDDVLTTGTSMEEARKTFGNALGVVVFCRQKCPEWITPLFQMQYFK